MALEPTDLPDQYIKNASRSGWEKGKIVYNGKIGTLEDWAEYLGRSRGNVSLRLSKMTLEDALKPARKFCGNSAYDPVSFYKNVLAKVRKPRMMPSGIPEITSLL